MGETLHVDLQKMLQGAAGPYKLSVQESLPATGVIALMGPSGAGKTSILRMLAGLMTPASGHIQIGQDCWYDSRKNLNRPVQKRPIGMVFQDYALFPHMNVHQNVAFGQRTDKAPERVTYWLEKLKLSALADQKPAFLSGGQQQRVALARALIGMPKILLLDEPLAAQDTRLRQELQQELRTLFSELNLLIILVSHSRTEVVRLADEVWFIEDGQTSWRGPTAERFGAHREIEAEVIRVYADRNMMALWTGKQMLEAEWNGQISLGTRLFFRKGKWEEMHPG